MCFLQCSKLFKVVGFEREWKGQVNAVEYDESDSHDQRILSYKVANLIQTPITDMNPLPTPLAPSSETPVIGST